MQAWRGTGITLGSTMISVIHECAERRLVNTPVVLECTSSLQAYNRYCMVMQVVTHNIRITTSQHMINFDVIYTYLFLSINFCHESNYLNFRASWKNLAPMPLVPELLSQPHTARVHSTSRSFCQRPMQGECRKTSNHWYTAILRRVCVAAKSLQSRSVMPIWCNSHETPSLISTAKKNRIIAECTSWPPEGKPPPCPPTNSLTFNLWHRRLWSELPRAR